MLQEVFEMFRAREPVPFIIFAFLAVGWIIILERLLLLQFVYRINFPKFNANVRKMLAAGDVERARTFCNATAKTGVPIIVARAIDSFQTDTFKVRMTVSEETLAFMPRIRRRLAQLPNLATASVLLGALAAVHGVWQSFHVTDVVELGVKSFAFTSGLSHALVPLALALVAAIALMIPYGFLEAVATRLEGEMEHSLTIVLNILAPETQAVVAAQPMVGAPGLMGESVRADEPSPMAEPVVAASKGEEDVPVERVEQIPDEEEII